MTVTIVPTTTVRSRCLSALAIATTAWLAAPLANAVPVSAHQIIADDPLATSGVYSIDPDGAGGTPAFEVYADMTSFGGGWTLGVNSLRSNPAASADMGANTGTVGLATAHTRDLGHLANLTDTQIRHEISNNGEVLFDGYYTGPYHGIFPSELSEWTIASGNLNAAFGSHVLGNDWSTVDNDVDDYFGNCAAYYGPWYHGACWTSHPGSTYGYSYGPYANAYGYVDSWRIYVRGSSMPVTTAAVPEPSTLALAGFGLVIAGVARRRRSPLRG